MSTLIVSFWGIATLLHRLYHVENEAARVPIQKTATTKSSARLAIASPSKWGAVDARQPVVQQFGLQETGTEWAGRNALGPFRL